VGGDVSPDDVAYVRHSDQSGGWHISADALGYRSLCGRTFAGSPLVWRRAEPAPPLDLFVCPDCVVAEGRRRTFDPDVAERAIRRAIEHHGCIDALGYGLQAVREVRRLRAELAAPRVISATDADEGEG
jgi:hypothetical protein